MSPHVAHDHVAPPGPVVRPAVPETERVADAALPQRPRQPLVVLAEAVVAAGHEDYVLPAQRVEPPGVPLVADEVRRVVRIDAPVVVVAGLLADVVEAAEAEHPLHVIGMAEGEAGGVVRAEARPGRD